MSLPHHNRWVYATAGWSGFFVMGIEMLGGRVLSPYFGTGIFVWGGIISVFMLCLSAGYLWGGHLSLRDPTLSGLLKILGFAALSALPIVAVGGETLEHLSYWIPDPRYGSLVGAFVLFGAPSVLSGMVSPYAVRLLIDDVDRSGQSAGRLYFVSTLGSAAGTLVTSFYLVLYWDIDTILMSLIAGSCLWAVALTWAQRRAETDSDA